MQTPTLDSAGYIFNFQSHGAFDPNGKLQAQPTQAQIDAHNSRLAARELNAMKISGRGSLYLFPMEKSGPFFVGTWASKQSERFPVFHVRQSRNNFGAQRTDVWFKFDGATWHGVNLGDNDIVRCKRTK